MYQTFKRLLVIIPFAVAMASIPVQGFASLDVISPSRELSRHEMPLNDRYPEPTVNQVFADNILLNLHYLAGSVKNASEIDWEKIRRPFTYEMVLQPGDVFAYHDSVLPQYQRKIVQTTNSHFNAQDGYLSSGYLYGDGVCHLASLINWAARDAGLSVTAPVNHDFRDIPDVPREYGTAIYYMPGDPAISQQQNLYVENTKSVPVAIVFESDGNKVTITVEEK